MVAALLVPTLFAYFGKNNSSLAAILSMLFGGTFTLIIIFSNIKLPYDLDPSFYGILISLVIFISVNIIDKKFVK